MKMKMKSMFVKNLVFFAAMLVMILVLVACGAEATSNEESDEEAASGNWPEKLVFTPIPLEDQQELTNRYEPFAEYLEEVLDIPVEIYPATNYAATVEAMRNGHTDLGYFGPFAYIHAESRANAEAFAGGITEPDEEPTYESYFITLEDSGIESIEDLEGASFLWADPTSASGHLFPKAHLVNELGIEVDKVDDMFGEVAFSGNHEASMLSVLNGNVSAAAVYDVTYNMILRENADHPNIDNLVIIEKTDPIPLPPFTVRGDLPEDLKETIKDAFYDAINVPELQEFLEDTGHGGGYVEVSDEDFEVVRMTADGLGMSPEELLD
ncbi:phosphate/phosphite/phosphonate ABC transporter substrate-binding protein [Oceanobacillus damuensis]|uniref:phosphate/phosphite/phosphonate ABC transporter substrate-binding protein n=1 Tax=Oceanobacillus damuensis TaxID=937928 RepID=UPI00082E397F|nr:phosphate/phosphite/phosphonate ABC transporter substrate-binding protein [Oceanobacillus damuensis]